ncbi:tRNA methyltransferase 11 [Spraguea lophii 42_110]|uniref:tRNA methyltransferase 11 n=1 Tax=Spraguea lophii (strain 42_110) TaxID=1358809 RepID=S7WAB4_SPRLO|nr:tRNA methyltransferase 11 [Spraguea lophii 42_110]
MDIFLLRFTHTYREFRKIEFIYLCKNNNIEYNILKDLEYNNPYMIVEMNIKDLDIILERSIFISKASYYVSEYILSYKNGNCYSIDHNYNNTGNVYSKCNKYSKCYNIKNPDNNFIPGRINDIISAMDYNTTRIKIRNFGCSVKKDGRNMIIGYFSYLVKDTKVLLDDSSLTYGIDVVNEDYDAVLIKNCNNISNKLGLYLSVFYKNSNRKKFLEMAVENRKFIGHTSFDLELSLFMVNVVKTNNVNIIYDPCMGSGSILLAGAILDTYVIGSDISKYEMVGDHIIIGENEVDPVLYSQQHKQTNNINLCENTINGNKIKINRKGVKTRALNENVYSNFKQFNLQKYLLGCFVSSVKNNIFNINDIANKHNNFYNGISIITDPPYGIRVSDKEIYDVIFNIKLLADKFLKNNMMVIVYLTDRSNLIEDIFYNYNIIIRIDQQMASYSRTFFFLKNKYY